MQQSILLLVFLVVIVSIGIPRVVSGAQFPNKICSAVQLAPGGFIEKSTDVTDRTLNDLSFIPSDRTTFNFPAPYNTKAYRLTIPADGTLFHQGYSYWNKINKHDDEDVMYIMVGFKETGPSLIRVNKITDEVTNLGPIWPAGDPRAGAIEDDFYMSTIDPHSFFYRDGPKFLKYNFMNQTETVVFDLDNSPWKNTYIFQPHSSADETRHIFTLREQGTFAVLGCAVAFTGNGSWALYRSEDYPDLDECNMDKSGRYITILCPITVFVDLDTGAQVSMTDENGGVGHLDTGYGTLVSPDNWANAAYRFYRYDYDTLIYNTPEPVTSHNLTIVYTSSSWAANAGGPNHVTWANAKRPEVVPWNQQFLCGSNIFDNELAKSREVICFRPDNSLDVLVVAPVMITMDGGSSYVYERFPFASIDQSGSYVVWSSNMMRSQRDELTMFLVKVPWQLLVDPEIYDVDTIYTPAAPVGNTPSGSQTPKAQTPSTKPVIAASTTMWVTSPLSIIVMVMVLLFF